jgi:hypothetical protein
MSDEGPIIASRALNGRSRSWICQRVRIWRAVALSGARDDALLRASKITTSEPSEPSARSVGRTRLKCRTATTVDPPRVGGLRASTVLRVTIGVPTPSRDPNCRRCDCG